MFKLLHLSDRNKLISKPPLTITFEPNAKLRSNSCSNQAQSMHFLLPLLWSQIDLCIDYWSLPFSAFWWFSQSVCIIRTLTYTTSTQTLWVRALSQCLTLRCSLSLCPSYLHCYWTVCFDIHCSWPSTLKRWLSTVGR